MNYVLDLLMELFMCKRPPASDKHPYSHNVRRLRSYLQPKEATSPLNHCFKGNPMRR